MHLQHAKDFMNETLILETELGEVSTYGTQAMLLLVTSCLTGKQDLKYGPLK